MKTISHRAFLLLNQESEEYDCSLRSERTVGWFVVVLSAALLASFAVYLHQSDMTQYRLFLWHIIIVLALGFIVYLFLFEDSLRLRKVNKYRQLMRWRQMKRLLSQDTVFRTCCAKLSKTQPGSEEEQLFLQEDAGWKELQQTVAGLMKSFSGKM